ncbi:hypothetical protein IIB79_09020 [candidate division KSB1 bacterium]|nr:hypothetical protein [candidate division KSB1 bacterium]
MKIVLSAFRSVYTEKSRHVFFSSIILVMLFNAGAVSQERPAPIFSGLVEPDGSVDWNRYYTNAETTQIMRDFTRIYPNLTRLRKIGESYLGVDLMLMEITNYGYKTAEEKPALYLDGGIHAGELTGSAVALYTMGYLLNKYGKDPGVTELLDTRTIYIRPKFNPDGSDLALIYDQSLRSSVHPVDSDYDGVPDDDPAEDLDGDGWITQMRYRVPMGEGTHVLDETDPRRMRREQGGDFIVIGEGIDNDGDGRINEDGIGGLDMNRNFPRNWELEHIQGGAGEYPLSEPETYATVKFINEHPNIVSIVHGHTSGGFVYRLPSASNPATFNQIDRDLIIDLGAFYTETTGRPVRASSTDPTSHRYGTLISWGYWDKGIIGWVPEYSPGGVWWNDYDGDGSISESEKHRFNDTELGGRYFSPWTKYDHPEFGEVEIGGWHTKFLGQNPPAEFLENECVQQIPWILSLIQKSPLIEISDPDITPMGEGRFRVETTVTNTGYLPTNLTERGFEGGGGRGGGGSTAGRNQIVQQVIATINVIGGSVVDGSKRQPIGHLAGTNTFSRAVTERSRTVSWIVVVNSENAYIQVTAASNSGGTVRTANVPLNR